MKRGRKSSKKESTQLQRGTLRGRKILEEESGITASKVKLVDLFPSPSPAEKGGREGLWEGPQDDSTSPTREKTGQHVISWKKGLGKNRYQAWKKTRGWEGERQNFPSRLASYLLSQKME